MAYVAFWCLAVKLENARYFLFWFRVISVSWRAGCGPLPMDLTELGKHLAFWDFCWALLTSVSPFPNSHQMVSLLNMPCTSSYGHSSSYMTDQALERVLCELAWLLSPESARPKVMAFRLITNKDLECRKSFLAGSTWKKPLSVCKQFYGEQCLVFNIWPNPLSSSSSSSFLSLSLPHCLTPPSLSPFFIPSLPPSLIICYFFFIVEKQF